jgi:hypothetical protein
LIDGIYWHSVQANRNPIQLGVFSNLIELTELNLGSYNRDLTPGMFPPSLKKLSFNDFSRPFKKGVLPHSLLELIVSVDFTSMKAEPKLPVKLPLTDLDIKHFAKFINSSVIPDSLISIKPEYLSIFLEKCPNDGKCTNNDKFHWERFRHVLQKQPYYPDYDEDGSLGELFGYDKRHYADETEDGSWGGGLFGYGTRLKSKMRKMRKRQSRKRQSRK